MNCRFSKYLFAFLLLGIVGRAAAEPELVFIASAANQQIWTSDSAGNTVSEFYSPSTVSSTIVFDFDSLAGHVYSLEVGGASSAIVRYDLDGKNATTIVPSISSALGVAVDPLTAKLYYSNSSGGGSRQIVSCNLDGSNCASLIPSSSGEEQVELRIDSSGGKIYWNESGGATNALMRANLDGSQVESLGQIGISGYSSPLGLDSINGKVYWLDLFSNRIYRANLDGTGTENIYSATGGIYLGQLAVDTSTIPATLYFTNISSSEVYKLVVGESSPTLVADSGDGLGALSEVALLAPVAPVITVQPESQAALVGDIVTFSVTATGTGTLSYQWRRNGVDLNGATAATLDTDSLLAADDGSVYSVVVTNVRNGVSISTVSVDAIVTVETVLTPETELESPPEVEVVSTSREITINFPPFDGASLLTGDARRRASLAPFARNSLSVRFEATVRETSSGRIRRVVTKNNKVSLTLGPGSYTASYNARIVKKRSADSKQKIVAAAKSQLNKLKEKRPTTSVLNKIQAVKSKIQLAGVRTVHQTNESPESDVFTIGE